MKTLRSLFCFAALLAMCLMGLASAQRTAPPDGAYVRQRVSSVEELAAQINKDPQVKSRFVRHFGVPPDQLTKYLREHVVITEVSSSTPSRVYIVTRDGRMVAQRRTLRRGATVFALKDTGEPLLVQSCGNPVLKKLPPREKVKSLSPEAFRTVRVNEVPLPPPTVAALPVAPTPPPSTPPVVAPAPVVAAAPMAPLPVKSVGLPLKVAAPLLLGLVGSHTSPPPPVVSEPGTILAACAILGPAAFVFRRRRSR